MLATTDRKTISLQTRLNYAITPELSLEFYGEPFVETGNFFHYGELLAARRCYLLIYGTAGTEIEEIPPEEPGDPATIVVRDGDDVFSFDDGDYVALSFRTNFVVPGSTCPAAPSSSSGSSTGATTSRSRIRIRQTSATCSTRSRHRARASSPSRSRTGWRSDTMHVYDQGESF